jgi:hypothetical protein
VRPGPAAIQPQTQPGGAQADAIMPSAGVLRFHANRIIYEAGAKDNPEKPVVLMGQVALSYDSDDHKQKLDITAENAVIFVDTGGGPAGGQTAPASKVRGIYLEDNVVISSGTYTVRAPRVYFDLALNKALLLEAVFYTYDDTVGVSAYIRAQEMQQLARSVWVARRAVVTTSEFAEPQFSVAADKLTLTQEPRPGGGKPIDHISAVNNVVRVGAAPIGYWPYMAGDADKTAMQSLSMGVNSQAGLEIHSSWDMFALTGQPNPDGVGLIGHADLEGRHGDSTGLDLSYNRPQMTGTLSGSVLPDDNFNDQIGGRNEVKFNDSTRGFVSWEHRQFLADNWQVSLEINKVSDPTFFEEFRPELAWDTPPLTTSIFAKKQEDGWAFTFLASNDLNTFTPEMPVLQAPGYTVDKQPELGFYNVGESFWHNRLTYFGENRVSRMRIITGSDSPATRGFTDAQALQLFGVPSADTSFADRLAAENLPADYRTRLDSRHEIDAPTKLSIFDLTPYAAARATFYDTDLPEDQPDNSDFRGWGTLGARAHTQFTRTDDQADIPLLDVHRLRHIIEPELDAFLTGSTFDSNSLPLYDPDVEGISDGPGARLGLRNTWQTQRGGPARWRSVDWIVLDTDLIFHGGTARSTDPLDRYIAYRPEYSIGGDHFHTRLLWMVSEVLSTTADTVTSLDGRGIEQWRIGLDIAASTRLHFGIGFDDLRSLDSQLITFNVRYTFTDKYAASFSESVDLVAQGYSIVSANIERKIPGWRLIFTGSVDTVNNVRTIGMLFYPEGQASAHLLTPLHHAGVESE